MRGKDCPNGQCWIMRVTTSTLSSTCPEVAPRRSVSTVTGSRRSPPSRNFTQSFLFTKNYTRFFTEDNTLPPYSRNNFSTTTGMIMLAGSKPRYGAKTKGANESSWGPNRGNPVQDDHFDALFGGSIVPEVEGGDAAADLRLALERDDQDEDAAPREQPLFPLTGQGAAASSSAHFQPPGNTSPKMAGAGRQRGENVLDSYWEDLFEEQGEDREVVRGGGSGVPGPRLVFDADGKIALMADAAAVGASVGAKKVPMKKPEKWSVQETELFFEVGTAGGWEVGFTTVC